MNTKLHYINWTPEEIDYLKTNFTNKNYENIAFQLNRSINSVKRKLKLLNLDSKIIKKKPNLTKRYSYEFILKILLESKTYIEAANKLECKPQQLHDFRRKNICFELTKEQFNNITQNNCTYCGIKPNQIKKINSPGQFIYNGIDRVDSNLGYLISNCVPCCKKCNTAKMKQSVEEFKSHISDIYNFFIKGNI